MPPGGDYQGRNSDSTFCRTCTDFKTWAKLHHTKSDTTSNVPESSTNDAESKPKPTRTDCPLDKDGLGTSTWGFLHTVAAYYPENPTENQKKDITQLFSIISRVYPCDSCAQHFRGLLARSPPVVNNRDDLSSWLCWIHNKVNERLHKPLFDCSKVLERWRNGWEDGSCD
uniref:Sulfhydryl oxidase n=1 Tax=Clastoptera arizonana TaxID=38151 RepID=A0A1B6DWF0_9HEMI